MTKQVYTIAMMYTDKYIAAEWEKQSCLWVGWPSHGDTDRWPQASLARARNEISYMISLAAQDQPVKVLACSGEPVDSAIAMVGDFAEIIDATFGDIWIRDTGPVFSVTNDAIRFRHNGWGGDFFYQHDDTIGDDIAAKSEKAIKRFDFQLEGGALDHNGQGAILTTRQCVLNENRNKWSEDEAERKLKNAFKAQYIYWLDKGLTADHTDGHVDNLARFVGVDTVLCQSPYGDDDPNAALFEKTANDLREMGLKVVQIPSPGRVCDEHNNVMPASYMNFIITNKSVIVPTYGTKSMQAALAGVQALFPKRHVYGAPSNVVLTGGGSFHCITQQEPFYDTKK